MATSSVFSKKYTRKLENRVNDIVLTYSKEPIIASAYSYHPAYYLDVYGKFIEPSNVLTFSQGTHFSKVKLYKKTGCLETENNFEELSAGKCMLKKGNILCVAPSPVSNKLRKNFQSNGNCKEWFTYVNTGIAFYSNKEGAHLNKTALGTDNNSIIIVCNAFCYAKEKVNNGKEYEICQPKVLGETTMRGGSGSDSEDEKKAEEAWDAEEEKYKLPENVKSVNLEKRIQLDAHTGPVNALVWDSKGTRLVSGSSDTTLRMWSYVVKNSIQPPDFNEYAKTDAAREWAKHKIKTYNPNTIQRGLVGYNWNEVNEQNIQFHLFNSGNGDESLEKIVKAMVLENGPDRVARDAYNKWLDLSRKKFDDEVKTAWEREEWKCDWISKQETSYGFPRYHETPILTVSWSPDDKYIASGSEDGSIILWKPEEGEFKQRLQRDKNLEAHTGPVRSLVWSYDSKTLYSGSEDGTVKVWKHEGHSFKLEHTLGESNTTKHAKFLCVNMNEKYIVAGTEDGFIYVWDVNNYKLLTVLKKHSESITGLFWKDPRDPEKIVNPPIDPKTKKVFDKPEPLLIKDPELLISTSLDKKIKIINIGNNVGRTTQSHAYNLTKKFMKKVTEEDAPRIYGRPDIGTVPGGPGYQKHVKEIEESQIQNVQEQREEGVENPEIRGFKLKVDGGKKRKTSKAKKNNKRSSKRK
jgi:WD40 repeat protein